MATIIGTEASLQRYQLGSRFIDADSAGNWWAALPSPETTDINVFVSEDEGVTWELKLTLDVNGESVPDSIRFSSNIAIGPNDEVAITHTSLVASAQRQRVFVGDINAGAVTIAVNTTAQALDTGGPNQVPIKMGEVRWVEVNPSVGGPDTYLLSIMTEGVSNNRVIFSSAKKNGTGAASTLISLNVQQLVTWTSPGNSLGASHASLALKYNSLNRKEALDPSAAQVLLVYHTGEYYSDLFSRQVTWNNTTDQWVLGSAFQLAYDALYLQHNGTDDFSGVSCCWDGTQWWAGVTEAVQGLKVWKITAGNGSAQQITGHSSITGRSLSMAADPSSGDVWVLSSGLLNSPTFLQKWAANTSSWNAVQTLETSTSSLRHAAIGPVSIAGALLYVWWDYVTSVTGRWFTAAIDVNILPGKPSLVSPRDNVVVDLSADQNLTFAHFDFDNDAQVDAEVRYRVLGGTWTTETGLGVSNYFTIPAGTLSAEVYEWQARTSDISGFGEWSESAFFSAATPIDAPEITVPASNEVIDYSPFVIQWTADFQDAYQIRTVADSNGSPNAAIVYYDSGVIESPGTRSDTVLFTDPNRIEHLQVRIRFEASWSNWDSVKVQSSFVSVLDQATPDIDFPVLTRKISGLAHNTRYAVRIRASTGLGVASDWSEALVFNVPGSGVFPSYPRSLKFNWVTSTLFIDWEPPLYNADSSFLSDLDHYKVYISSSEKTVDYTVPGSYFNYTMDQMVADFGEAQTTFSISVTAVNKDGNESAKTNGIARLGGDSSDPGDVEGAPSDSPDVGLIIGGVGFLMVQWEHPVESNFPIYQVHISTANNFTPNEDTLLATTPSNYFFIRNLGPGAGGATLAYDTNYYVRLVAMNDAGDEAAPGAQGVGQLSRANTADINVGAITAASAIIADAAIGSAQIQDLAVTTAKIANLNVTNAKIADLAVTNAKINDLSASKITAGTISASISISAPTISGGNISGTNISGSTVTGGTFQTQSTGARVVITDSDVDRITFWNGTTQRETVLENTGSAGSGLLIASLGSVGFYNLNTDGTIGSARASITSGGVTSQGSSVLTFANHNHNTGSGFSTSTNSAYTNGDGAIYTGGAVSSGLGAQSGTSTDSGHSHLVNRHKHDLGTHYHTFSI